MGNFHILYYANFVPLFLNLFLKISFFLCSIQNLITLICLVQTPRNAELKDPKSGIWLQWG